MWTLLCEYSERHFRISYKIIYMTKYRAEGNIVVRGRVTHLLSADISASRYVRKTISLTSWSRGRIGICGVNRKAPALLRLYHGVLSHGTADKDSARFTVMQGPRGEGNGEKESSRLDFPPVVYLISMAALELSFSVAGAKISQSLGRTLQHPAAVS